MTLEKLKQLVNELPHSSARMPYTYHHDAMRSFIQQKTGTLPSRSDIAELKSENEEELYTVAIYEVMNYLSPLEWFEIEREHIKDLKNIYQEALVLITKFFERNYELKYARK